MERSYPDWTSLPAEILSRIFHYPGMYRHWPEPYYLPQPYYSQYDLSQAALVCKAWKNPAQSSLYSHFKIYSNLQLRKFHDVVTSNNYFGSMVKVLELKIDDDEEEDAELPDIVTDLLSNCLPNLEYFYLRRYHSYAATLNALLDSKLKYLKSIQLPEYSIYPRNNDELIHYVSCVFLMKERLQEVYITDDPSNYLDEGTGELAIIKFQQLYDNLDQFNNLTTINIERQTDDCVQLLEHIVETCRSLRDVEIKLSSKNNQHDLVQSKDNISFDTISHYIPRYNIKTLTITQSISAFDNYKVLLYITKKFPNLEEFRLRPDKTFVEVTPQFFTQLLNCLGTVKWGLGYVLMNLDDICQIIGNFWNTTVKPGVVKLLFRYCNRVSYNGEKYDFSIRKDNTGTEIDLECPLQFFDRQPHIEFIVEKIGNFIVDLRLSIHDFRDTSETFLIYIFMHCPNLRNLHIEGFKLHGCIHSRFDKANKYNLDKLTLERHCINAGTLEHLSTILSEVKELRLINSTDYRYSLGNRYCYFKNDDQIDYITRIDMPQTKIQRITFGSYMNSTPIYVKQFVAADQKYYYYRSKYNSTKNREPITNTGEQIDESIYDKGVVMYDEVDGWCTEKREPITNTGKKIYTEWEGEPVTITMDARGDEKDGCRTEKFYVCCQTKLEIMFEYVDFFSF